MTLSSHVSLIQASDAPKNRIGIYNSYETLNNGQSPWQLQTLEWKSEKNKFSTTVFELNRYNRFDQVDFSYTAEYIKFVTPDWNIDTTLIYTPNAKIIKNYSAQIWSRHNYSRGWVLGIGLNYAVYPTDTDDVRTGAVLAEAEKYISQFRFAYKLISTNARLPGASSQTLFSHTFASSYYYSEKSSLSFTLASGREVENDGSSSPPISQIHAVSMKHVHYFSESWQSVVGLNWHRQGNLYVRSGFTIGFTYDL